MKRNFLPSLNILFLKLVWWDNFVATLNEMVDWCEVLNFVSNWYTTACPTITFEPYIMFIVLQVYEGFAIESVAIVSVLIDSYWRWRLPRTTITLIRVSNAKRLDKLLCRCVQPCVAHNMKLFLMMTMWRWWQRWSYRCRHQIPSNLRRTNKVPNIIKWITSLVPLLSEFRTLWSRFWLF